MKTLPNGRTTWTCEVLNEYRPPMADGRHQVDADDNHNLVSSLLEDGKHMPAIDIDVPHSYIPSSTPGHGHLFLDVPMSWDQYETLLTVLNAVGLIEDGFYRLSLERKASFLRAPGVYKEGFKGVPKEEEAF